MPTRFMATLAVMLLVAAAVLGKPLPGMSKRNQYISLAPSANLKLKDSLGNYEGNNLSELPVGENVFGNVIFKIDDGVVQLSGNQMKKERPTKVEGIKVERRLAKLHILQGTSFGSQNPPNFAADGTLIAEYKIHFMDKTTAVIPIEYGRDLRDWNDQDESKPVTRGILGWTGNNDLGRARQKQGAKFGNKLRLYVTTWENPHPDKLIDRLDYSSTNSVCAPFCIALTAETAAPGKKVESQENK